MAGKSTDYTNAQFDDAYLRIKALYDRIKKQGGDGSNDASFVYEIETSQGFLNYGVVYSYCARKKGRKVSMTCVVYFGGGLGQERFPRAITVADGWAVPPSGRTYEAHDDGGNSVEVSADGRQNTVAIDMWAWDSRVVAPLIVEASWEA